MNFSFGNSDYLHYWLRTVIYTTPSSSHVTSDWYTFVYWITFHGYHNINNYFFRKVFSLSFPAEVVSRRSLFLRCCHLSLMMDPNLGALEMIILLRYWFRDRNLWIASAILSKLKASVNTVDETYKYSRKKILQLFCVLHTKLLGYNVSAILLKCVFTFSYFYNFALAIYYFSIELKYFPHISHIPSLNCLVCVPYLLNINRI